ncbi:hypothetical protein BDV29DRAFT_186650 [Aspergillus leporis]|uniref:Uncharacterized protein n=1 Tax=Aspergillus leporis TaxID=41062 RepID=A0A5N5WFW3_9EURO|nr:hypothetical protein BDV29DRAFT_186650 [Aspergillus leporis]
MLNSNVCYTRIRKDPYFDQRILITVIFNRDVCFRLEFNLRTVRFVRWDDKLRMYVLRGFIADPLLDSRSWGTEPSMIDRTGRQNGSMKGST